MSETVLITGGARGIGKATAYAFARSGYNVVINYNTSQEQARAISEDLTRQGHTAIPIKADVTNRTEVDEMVDFIVKRFGKIEALVNNAGVSQIRLFTDIEESDWDYVINTNLKGTFNCCQAAVPNMISNKYGKIINLSSMWGEVGASCEVHYSASKAGVIGLTKALAKELGPSNIMVNCVAPGFISTEMNEAISQEDTESLMEITPIGRLGRVEDVADAILFLASKTSNFVTGQVLGVNGGFVI